ncbi:MAG TPA: hypothetical protein VLB80_02475 [Candidatus Babeliales bacterium]|nr:hypothetical protein [Candidatus Babeliales bacterium]
MLIYCVIALGLCSSTLFGMSPRSAQLEVCGTLRKEYNQEYIQHMLQDPEACFFCDPNVLSTNYILYESYENNIRVMINKYPHFDFDQGYHLLIMPISHKGSTTDFSKEELMSLAKVIHDYSGKLYPTAYSQEFFMNWGSVAGQSIPHGHGQFKSYVKPPQSLSEQLQAEKNSYITNIEDAYAALKVVLNSDYGKITPDVIVYGNEKCDCCAVENNEMMDEINLVIGRFKYNYVCLSHYPSMPAEISIVPNQHVSALKDLPLDALQENMILSIALLSIVEEYAQKNIFECGGSSLYIKSIGAKTSNVEKSKYHVHTVVTPRTKMQPTLGAFSGNSFKLDIDPVHFAEYLKAKVDYLKELVV